MTLQKSKLLDILNNSPIMEVTKAPTVGERYKPLPHETEFLVWVSGEADTCDGMGYTTCTFDDRWRLGWRMPGSKNKFVTDDGLVFDFDGFPPLGESSYYIKAFAKLPKNIS